MPRASETPTVTRRISGPGASHRESGGTSWAQVGLPGALLAGGVVFVHVPAQLWAGNVPEFTFGFVPFLGLGLAFLTGTVLTAWLALRLLPVAARLPAACAIGAAGLACWGYGMIFVGRMHVLNGVDAPMEFDTGAGAWELLLVGAVVAALARAGARHPHVARRLLLALNAVLALATSATVAAAPRLSAAGDPAAVFRFSPRQNVLAVLFDGLQSDVADRVLRGDPSLAARFDGFRWFKDTIAVAPTTFLNLPAIHSGEPYRPPRALGPYFTDAIERHSFMNRFARAGYATTLVHPVEGLCPAGVTACVRTADLRSPWQRLRSEAVRLFDLSLFRVSPVWLKRRIYADGRWLLAGRFDRPDEINRIVEGNRYLEAIARRMVVKGDTPAMTFLHILSTHTPYVLREDCRTIGESALGHLESQARCALLAMGLVLESLKANGVYDNTVVLVFADHGVNPGVFGDPAAREFRHLAGVASPAFLLKPLGGRGALTDAPGAVTLADVGATLCAASGACRVPLGFPAGTAPAERPRPFHAYEWRHAYWSQRDIPGMTHYEIRGPVWEPGSWHRVD